MYGIFLGVFVLYRDWNLILDDIVSHRHNQRNWDNGQIDFCVCLHHKSDRRSSLQRLFVFLDWWLWIKECYTNVLGSGCSCFQRRSTISISWWLFHGYNFIVVFPIYWWHYGSFDDRHHARKRWAWVKTISKFISKYHIWNFWFPASTICLGLHLVSYWWQIPFKVGSHLNNRCQHPSFDFSYNRYIEQTQPQWSLGR